MREDPIASITLKSNLIFPTRIAFDVELDDDTINVRFRDLPSAGAPWYADYDSNRYGSGSRPLENVPGGREATPLDLAESLCKEIGAPNPVSITNIEENTVDLIVPDFIQTGLVRPNHPKRDSGIEIKKVCVLFADLRGFSTWSTNVPLDDVALVFRVISDFVIQMAADDRFDYWKLLGDGIMLVWETPDGDTELLADIAIEAAFELHKRYSWFRDEVATEVPEGFGVAITGGDVVKHWSTNWLESLLVVDYLGPIVNHAARLQSLAKAGDVLVNKAVPSSSTRYSFEDVTDSLADQLEKLKGLAEHATFLVRK